VKGAALATTVKTLRNFIGGDWARTGWGRIGGRSTMPDMTDLKTVVLDVGLD
jgi:hypothetical protein